MNRQKAKIAIIMTVLVSLILALVFLLVYWHFKNQVTPDLVNKISYLCRQWWFMLSISIGGPLVSTVYYSYRADFMTIIPLPFMAIGCMYLGYLLSREVNIFQKFDFYNTLVWSNYLSSGISIFILLSGQLYIWIKIWSRSKRNH